MTWRWEDMVLVGRIARPHGLRGEVLVNLETDFPDERFKSGATVYLLEEGEPRERRIAASRVHGGRPLVALEGVETLEAAERLAGAELRVPESALGPLPPGSYYWHELVGCTVLTGAGDLVGEAVRIDEAGGHQLLVVEGVEGEVLVPLAGGIVSAVDTTARRITIDGPEGLLDLNRTARRRRRPRRRAG